MAKRRIYPNVISARLTEAEKEKLEAVIQQLQSNKSEFMRDVINSFINKFTIKV